MSNEQTRSPAGSQCHPVTADLLAAFRNFGFLACAVLLVCFAVGFHVLIHKSGITLMKKPVPLRKELAELKKEKLAPYVLLDARTLQPEVLDQLGTDKYLQWILSDPTGSDGRRSKRIIALFLTYNTGSPDPVPHVAEECLTAAGHEIKQQKQDTVNISTRSSNLEVPIRVLDTQRQGRLLDQNDQVVIYTFHANGQFRGHRGKVRSAIAAPFAEYAYFSKLEIGLNIGPEAYASRAEAIEAGKRFLQVIIPVLLEEHWPDWDAVIGESEPQTDTRDASG